MNEIQVVKTLLNQYIMPIFLPKLDQNDINKWSLEPLNPNLITCFNLNKIKQYKS